MIKMLLPLLCFFTVAIADNTCNYQANGNFNSSNLFSNNLYEIMFTDSANQLLSACTGFVFAQTGCGEITYQYGDLEPGLDGNFISKAFTLKENCNGQFDVITNGQTGSVFILDFASDSNWIIIGDTNDDFLSMLSKNRQSLNGLDRGLELASQYSQTSQHLDLQVSQYQCPYSSFVTKLKTARNS